MQLEQVSAEKTTGRLKFFSAAFSAQVLWGFMSIPLRLIQGWPVEDILYYRILVSVVCIWVFILVFRKKHLNADIFYYRQLDSPKKRNFWLLLLLASMLILGNWFTFIYVVNHFSVQSAAFAYLVCPLLTTLAAFLILKEELSMIKKISIGIAFLSVFMLVRGSWVEVCWSIGIASLYALYLVVQRVTRHVDKLNVLAAQLTICTIAILPALLWQHHALPLDGTFWLVIVVIAIVFTIIPLYMSLYALNGIPSSTVGILIYINPIIAFAVAVFYFRETISPQQIMAYSILLIAVLLFNWATIRKVLLSKKRAH